MSSDISTEKYQSSSQRYRFFTLAASERSCIAYISRMDSKTRVLYCGGYYTIVARIGRALYIEAGVELLGGNFIEIGMRL